MALPGFKDPQMVRITPAHCYHRHYTGEDYTKWSVIEKIEKDEQHFFFNIDKTPVLIVPKRAFATEAESDLFYQSALEFWKAGRSITE